MVLYFVKVSRIKPLYFSLGSGGRLFYESIVFLMRAKLQNILKIKLFFSFYFQ